MLRTYLLAWGRLLLYIKCISGGIKMKYLIYLVFVLVLSSSYVFSQKIDSMIIFPYAERTTVAINENFTTNKKLDEVFDAFGGSLMITKVAETEDVTISCKRRLGVSTCTFAFISSSNVKIDGNTTNVYIEKDYAPSIMTSKDISLEFKNREGDTFYLEITPRSFTAESKKR